ncbi:39S ribosomal protein L33, mitochondrial [Basidiobolus ranarum]|uniref:Large ribosomal subunit protein uL30m n=1 Tax=Basidiobolus ranarum TaxID=34480 RepID=A0ABR2WE29_9FUNG
MNATRSLFVRRVVPRISEPTQKLPDQEYARQKAQNAYKWLSKDAKKTVDEGNKLQPTGFFKITLIRSCIGLHPKTRRAVKALGFRRLQQTVFRPQTSDVAGTILKLKEILKVHNVKQPHETRVKAARGFVVERPHGFTY